jgi:hypothetical protein
MTSRVGSQEAGTEAQRRYALQGDLISVALLITMKSDTFKD